MSKAGKLRKPSVAASREGSGGLQDVRLDVIPDHVQCHCPWIFENAFRPFE